MSTPTYEQFYRDVLGHLGVKPTTGNLRAFGVITIIEGKNHYFNPMNWVMPTGYPRYNSTGVRKYPNPDTGARLTAANLLDNERCSPFVKSLRGARTRYGPLRAIAKIYASWGSHPAFLSISKERAAAVLTEQMPS